MKFDMIYLVNLILLLSISTFLFIYLKSYLLNKKRSFNKITFINVDNENFSYCINFTLDKYNTYEKIDIWRYCTLF